MRERRVSRASPPALSSLPEKHMNRFLHRIIVWGVALVSIAFSRPASAAEQKARTIAINPAPIASDKSVKYDYDIVYVRAPRRADGKEINWAEFGHPTNMEVGADLVL